MPKKGHGHTTRLRGYMPIMNPLAVPVPTRPCHRTIEDFSLEELVELQVKLEGWIAHPSERWNVYPQGTPDLD